MKRWLRRLFRPRIVIDPAEVQALGVAIHFLRKPLSELKQYRSDTPLFGPNSLRRLNGLKKKLVAEAYDGKEYLYTWADVRD